MTITDSRLKDGTLTFGSGTPVSFACQATNVTITPTYKDDGDAVETLCGDSIAAATSRTDSLKITAIQDFTDPDGFQRYSWAHDQETVAFTWKPNSTGPTFSGDVQVRALDMGGDVNKRNTVDAEWTIVGITTLV